MGDVAGDGLGGASDSAIGDVSAADVVHGGGVGPVGVDSRVAVVGALNSSKLSQNFESTIQAGGSRCSG